MMPAPVPVISPCRIYEETMQRRARARRGARLQFYARAYPERQ